MEHYLSLKDHVYRYISDCINTGSLNPGDKINEAQVSETLNISRTPIREALVQLASDGYLDSLPRKGFRVKALDTTKVQQFYEIIGALDGRAAALCMPHITKEDLNQMQFLAEAMDSAIHAGLGDKYYELQVEFHNVYLNRCPNTEMTDLLNRLKNNFIRKYYLSENPDNENSVLEEPINSTMRSSAYSAKRKPRNWSSIYETSTGTAARPSSTHCRLIRRDRANWIKRMKIQ